MDTYKTITLHSGETLVTEEERLVYQVQSGRVRVFIAPLVNGDNQRRVLLCELEAGRSIPSAVSTGPSVTAGRGCSTPSE